MEVKTQTMKLSSLKLNPDNPRRIGNKEMERLVKSLQEFPDMMSIREIVVDETMTVLGGNMRLIALKKSGAKECIAKIVTGLTPEQKREFIIKDNVAFGEFDFDILANGWDGLPLVDWGVDLPEDWLKEEVSSGDAPAQLDRAEELNKVWQAKLGDLWQIGEHRLLCGDATKSEDVERVMGAERAGAVVTDPPYGVAVVKSGMVGADFGIAKKGKYAPVEGDDKTPDIRHLLDLSGKQIIWGGNYFADQLSAVGSWLIWDKRGDSGIENTFADCELAWSNIGCPARIYRQLWNGMIREGEHDKRVHPTQKPVGLLQWCIKKTEGIIIDPYIGSGTTMVACQNLNRKCRGIEISPQYVAVCLERMKTAFPGIEIKKM